MSSPRGKWLLAIAAAVTASCWDGALDPIIGSPDDGDQDTETEEDTGSDSETGTDTGVEPVACTVLVPIYDPDSDYVVCTYEAPGTCVGEASECVGCAWAEAVATGCSDGQSCCIGEDELHQCSSWWGSSDCGYEEDSCPEDSWTVWSTEPSELPACPGGAFCCS